MILYFYILTLLKLKIYKYIYLENQKITQRSKNTQYIAISDCCEDWRRLCQIYFKEYFETTCVSQGK